MTKIGRLRDGTSPVGLLPYLNAIDNVLPSSTPISGLGLSASALTGPRQSCRWRPTADGRARVSATGHLPAAQERKPDLPALESAMPPCAIVQARTLSVCSRPKARSLAWRIREWPPNSNRCWPRSGFCSWLGYSRFTRRLVGRLLRVWHPARLGEPYPQFEERMAAVGLVVPAPIKPFPGSYQFVSIKTRPRSVRPKMQKLICASANRSGRALEAVAAPPSNAAQQIEVITW